MKCAHCGRDMRSTRKVITEVIMMDVIKRFETKLCITCRKQRWNDLHKKK